MERLLTKDELERQLEAKRSDIDARVDALKSELTTAGDDARQFFVEEPLKVAGGIVGLGLIVGLVIVGGRSRRRKRRLSRSHRSMIERYAEALAKDVRHRMRRGADEESAFRAAFRNHMPLIVLEAERDVEEEVQKGMVRETLDLALKTALGFMVKVLIDRLSDQFDVEGRVDRMVTGVMGPSPATKPAEPKAGPPSTESQLG